MVWLASDYLGHFPSSFCMPFGTVDYHISRQRLAAVAGAEMTRTRVSSTVKDGVRGSAEVLSQAFVLLLERIGRLQAFSRCNHWVPYGNEANDCRIARHMVPVSINTAQRIVSDIAIKVKALGSSILA